MKNQNKIIIKILTILSISLLFISCGDDTEYLSGTVEATRIDVASKIPGRINEILIAEGDNVSKGDTLAILESKEMDAKYGQLLGKVNSAKFQYEKAKNGARKEEIEMARNQFEVAQNQFELASKTYDRMSSLFADSLISLQEMDQIKFKYTAAKDQMNAAKAQYDMATTGARSEDIKMAQGVYDAAKSGLEEVEAYIDELYIKSPIDGELQTKIINTGEIAASGYPIFTIIDLSDKWVLLQIKETEMNDFKKGTIHSGKIPALDNQRVDFKVNYIAPMGDFATWKPTNRKGDFDIRTFEVRLRSTEEIKDLRPGMTVLF